MEQRTNEQRKNEQQMALVLGATGGIGGELARRLVAGGWRVRALARGPRALAASGVEWVTGDAMRQEDVVAAAQGASLIVHAVNPPGYRNWSELVLPMLENTIAAAKASGARVVLPGTLYNFGPEAGPLLDEQTAQLPSSRKGAIRVQMERRLQEAAAEGIKVVVVRAGDFFGPRVGNNWFSQGLVKAATPITAITYPGRAGIGHSWAYLPDLADTIVRLVAQEARLSPFEVFHFRGHWDADGSAMIAAVRQAAGNDALPVRRLPWSVLWLLSPFVTLFKEMIEVRYFWQRSFALDNAKLVRLIGSETHTPFALAVADTLAGLGCLPPPTLGVRQA